jgi:hypothetical protein
MAGGSGDDSSTQQTTRSRRHEPQMHSEGHAHHSAELQSHAAVLLQFVRSNELCGSIQTSRISTGFVTNDLEPASRRHLHHGEVANFTPDSLVHDYSFTVLVALFDIQRELNRALVSAFLGHQ